MTKNSILDELHATRERLMAESEGTITGLLDRLRADQAASDRPTFKPAKPRESLTSLGGRVGCDEEL